MVMLNGKEYSKEDMEVLKELATIFKNDPASLTVTSQPMYGPYQSGSGQFGLLSYPGIRPDMFSTIQHPHTLGRILGVRPSTIANEKVGIITGVTAASGSNPSDWCGDPMMAGQLKRCVQNYIFGKFFMKTRLNVLPEMGEYVDRADVEKRILNLEISPNPFVPDVAKRIDLNRREGVQLAYELYAAGIAMERSFEVVAVRGNQTLAPASTQAGWMKEFNGLERQVTTGRVDLDTQQACPAADSTVISWNAGVDSTVGGRTLFQAITDEVYAKVDLAERVGLGGVQFAFVMSSRLFRAISYVWSCAYWTSRCVGTAGNPQTVDATRIRELQLEMFNNKVLPVDGVNYPVIISDGIRTNRTGSNIFSDDNLFFIPVEWQGRRLLNLEYKPMDNADVNAFNEFGAVPIAKPTQNGMFLIGTNHRNGMCVEFLLAAKMRMILDAPFLAFVINSVSYTYAAQYRDPFPGSTDHFNGGVTTWDGNYTAS